MNDNDRHHVVVAEVVDAELHPGVGVVSMQAVVHPANPTPHPSDFLSGAERADAHEVRRALESPPGPVTVK